ncbi:MAG: hydrogenase iron-sulfur subunit [Methanosarcinaceae archaeon]|nr:hydrogenase iron-sulfur subunit [Methanosarcinaceae archaeon]
MTAEIECEQNKRVSVSREGWTPKIVMFCCNWCSYAGADGAGVARLQQETNVRVIRVMCSSRVDAVHIYTAFLEGADGVLITGCHLGDCHYVNGNEKTLVKYKFIKSMLDEMGIEDERLQLQWISASEGQQYAAFVNEMTEKIRKLGPSPFRKPEVI